MAAIIRPKAERKALDKIHKPVAEGTKIAGVADYYDARKESRNIQAKRHGGGRTVVSIPAMPWHKDK